MSRFAVRASKFRHIFGQPYKVDQCYNEIKVTKSSWDGPFCSVNPKFIAVVTESVGGGSFIVIPLGRTGRVDRSAPRVIGHKDLVLDITWSPFNDNIIASGSEDATIKIWEIPDEGLVTDLTEPLITLEGHQRKVGVVVWHPTASNILCSGGADNQVIVWDVESGAQIMQVDLGNLIFCISFNYDGSRLVATTKNKKMHIIDARSGEILQTGQPYEGTKGTQVVYLKNGKLVATGFSRSSERQISLYDENNLDKPLAQLEIDNSNGVLFPVYDSDSQVIYLCGKGDSIVRYYEVTEQAPYLHFLNLYNATTSMRGFAFMHKRALEVSKCEIARMYKLLNNGVCEIIPFIVPRKSDLFQDDLYPDTPGDEPALTAEEWINGKNADPVLMSLRQDTKAASKPKAKMMKRNIVPTKTTEKRVNAGDSESAKPSASSAASGEPAAESALPPVADDAVPEIDISAILKDITELKSTVETQGKQIKELEGRLSKLETEGSTTMDYVLADQSPEESD